MTVPPSSHPLGAIEPGPECALCLRLQAFRQVNRGDHPDWHNAPVPSFGGEDAALLIVGLAPGLRGANKTGRPFTGDFAGDLLYSCLAKFEFSDGDYDARPDDGLRLLNCRITNAVRCVPPQNKPVGAEVTTCRRFLIDEIGSLKRLKIILALGTVAHGAVLAALGEKKSARKFGHRQFHDLSGGLVLADSYHCSRYNTNTGRLTEDMFEAVFRDIRARLSS